MDESEAEGPKSSYETINYRLRPAKTVERKMLCDAFRRLAVFARLESYRYVGFGSPYFSDFTMIHRALRITDMLSIERDAENKDRFEFNKPFHCIAMRYGESTDILPELQWQRRSIVWLDYDGPLTSAVLADVGFVCTSAHPGSVLVVTVNAHPDNMSTVPAPEVNERRLDRLKKRVGPEKVPIQVNGKQLVKWGLAEVCRQIVSNEIADVISQRNGTRAAGDRMKYRQLFNFQYADGARMLTTGGVIYDEGLEPTLASAEFEQLDFVQTGETPYRIEVPPLTYKEIRHLDAQLPSEGISVPKVRPEQVEAYARIYRYFPAFTEGDI